MTGPPAASFAYAVLCGSLAKAAVTSGGPSTRSPQVMADEPPLLPGGHLSSVQVDGRWILTPRASLRICSWEGSPGAIVGVTLHLGWNLILS